MGKDKERVPERGKERVPERRKAVQRLVGYLVENPDKAREFLMQPATVAMDLGIVVNASEMDLIRAAISELGRNGKMIDIKDIGVGAEHIDFPECHHVEVPRPNLWDLVINPAE